MSQAEAPNSLKNLIKSLGETAAYPAIIIGYLVALTGQVPGLYPHTTSLLTLFISTVLLVTWRIKAIRRVEANPEPPPADPPPTRPRWREELDFLDRASGKGYTFSLTRRRFECGVLAALALCSLAWAGAKAEDSFHEIQNPRLTCSLYDRSKPRIIIADLFAASEQDNTDLVDRLYNFLDQRDIRYDERRFDVCRLRKSVSLNTEAQKLVNENGASLLVWGRRSANVYEIFLEGPAASGFKHTLAQLNPQQSEQDGFLLDESERLGYMIGFAVSDLLVTNNELEQARTHLLATLSEAKHANFAQKHPEEIAMGYFRLGELYGMNTSTVEPDYQQAIQAYTLVLDWQSDLYRAVLNRGMVYMDIGEHEAAMDDFTLLIERDTPHKFSAYLNRGVLREEAGDLQGADQDFENAIAHSVRDEKFAVYMMRGQVRLSRNDFEGAIADCQQAAFLQPGHVSYRVLGYAQLLGGQLDAAAETYLRMIPYLNEETRQMELAVLQDLAQTQPDLQPVIEEISASLKQAELPELTP